MQLNKNWKYQQFDTLFDWCEKSKIKSGAGKQNGKYKMFVCSDTDVKYYDEYLQDSEALVFGTGGKASCHYVNDKFAYSTDCIVAVKSSNELLLKFYYYFLRQQNMKLIQQTFTGSGLEHTSKKKIGQLLVPVPPLPEQQRIVAKIEELFAELDNSVAMLKKVKEQLEVYRQAVLEKAFEIANEKCVILPISKLLSKTKKGMTTGPFGTMLKKNEYQKEGIPVIGIDNIDRGSFINKYRLFVSEKKAKELKNFQVFKDDIIFSRSGTVGELCIVPNVEMVLLSTNLIKISLDNSVILPQYFVWLFQSKNIVLDQVKELCKGSTRAFLNQTILKQIDFPVPSLSVQENLIKEIETNNTFVREIDKILDTSLQQADALRQSILKKAFEGEL